MKRSISLLLCLAMVLGLCMVLTGCGTSLCGEWESDSLNLLAPTSLVLNEDGSCVMDGIALYTWRTEGDTLYIVAPSLLGGDEYSAETEYSYELNGKTLVLNGTYGYHR